MKNKCEYCGAVTNKNIFWKVILWIFAAYGGFSLGCVIGGVIG